MDVDVSKRFMIKVLHIANDYAGSTVYMNLARELDNLGIEQTIYTPVRGTATVGNNAIEFKCKKSKIIYSSLLNWHIDRIFYPYKIFKILKDIQKKVDFSQIDFIHAHTWYSDGGVAFFLSKKYNIPFVVAVRSTDFNVFYKKLLYLRSFGRVILEKSKKIILISASSEPKLLELKSLKTSWEKLKNKVITLPNGVSPYWIKNAIVDESLKLKSSGVVNLIYVGTFIKRKKLLEIQRAVIELNKNVGQNKVHLHIVGGGGTSEAKVMELIKQHPNHFTYHGKIHDKDELADLYRAADIFVMPSLSETFGLVYVEAMLQGLPILYTANEGIDGFYPESIGEKVQTPTVQEIAEKLSVMIENLNGYSIPAEALKQNHDWAEIAKQYLSIYEENL